MAMVPRVTARATGRTPHPLMQWHAIVGSPDRVNMEAGRTDQAVQTSSGRATVADSI